MLKIDGLPVSQIAVSLGKSETKETKVIIHKAGIAKKGTTLKGLYKILKEEFEPKKKKAER